MHRFRVECVGGGDTVRLSDEGQIHHLKNVLRLTEGDEIALFDDCGRECVCTVDRFERAGVTLTVKARREVPARKVSLMIACALPKKGMDDVVDKLTQLGVDTIVPMRTTRVVVRLSEESARRRVERWRRVARAAAEQSQRTTVPEVRAVTDFASVVAKAPAFDLKLMPTLSGERRMLPEVLFGSRPDSVLVLIGPEGDFTVEEVAYARNAGFVPVSLGDQVLRVDTAAIALGAYLRLAAIV